VRVLDASLEGTGLKATTGVAITGSDLERVFLTDTRPCSPDLLSDRPLSVRLHVRTLRGTRALLDLPPSSEIGADVSFLARQRCGYLGPLTALVAVPTAVAADGRQATVTLTLRDAAAWDLRLLAFHTVAGLHVTSSRALPLTLPHAPVLDPTLLGSPVPLTLHLRVTDCRAFVSTALDSPGSAPLTVVAATPESQEELPFSLNGLNPPPGSPDMPDAMFALLRACGA
jgi:hypothetical protein